MKILKLTRGKQTILDDQDYAWVKKFKWYAYKSKNNYYAWRLSGVQLHREILGLKNKDGKIVDHKNGNGLDNRRENLRVCTVAENCRNARTHTKLKSNKFKGVSWSPGHKKWVTKIIINYKQKHLGYFDNEELAAEAYNKAAINYFGKFAKINRIK